MAKVSRVTKEAKLDKRSLSGKAANNKLGEQKVLVNKLQKNLE